MQKDVTGYEGIDNAKQSRHFLPLQIRMKHDSVKNSCKESGESPRRPSPCIVNTIGIWPNVGELKEHSHFDTHFAQSQ